MDVETGSQLVATRIMTLREILINKVARNIMENAALTDQHNKVDLKKLSISKCQCVIIVAATYENVSTNLQ